MSSVDTYNSRSTSFGFAWPPEVTGLERIILSAQGDLQRNLSAFFACPITVAVVYSRSYLEESPEAELVSLALPNSTAVASASPARPIIQQRKVNLMCSGKIVCTATSTVRIASVECARYVLEEKYAIGQVFRRLAKPPTFELSEVGIGPKSVECKKGDARDQLWRSYRLFVPEFECDILEVFPSREMFTHCERWLTGSPTDDRTVGRARLLNTPNPKQFIHSLYRYFILAVTVLELGRFYALVQKLN